MLTLIFVACRCSSTQDPSEQWEEQGNNVQELNLVPGIAAHHEKTIEYKRKGEHALTVTLEDPVVISVADKPEKWGFFQFPEIYKTVDGEIFVRWSIAADAIASYGKGGHSYAVTEDGGKTWSTPRSDSLKSAGLELTNGDRIQVYTPPALRKEEVKVSDSIGFSFVTTSSKANGYTFYRMRDLPDALQGVYIDRLSNGETRWKIDHATLNDPQAVRYSRVGLFPVVWWGDLQRAEDGSVIAGMYPAHVQEPSGEIRPSGITFYRSADEGRTWEVLSRVPYQPDLTVDPKGNERLVFGFTEPAFEILSNGTYVTVLRTNGPMYISRSTDQGKQWTKPEPFTQRGVLPRMLELENGVTVLASGRPGVQLRFSWDGNGETWTDPFEMMPYEGEKEYVSCGYTGLLATGPDRFLFVYSDFKHLNEHNEVRKAIKVREVIVKKP